MAEPVKRKIERRKGLNRVFGDGDMERLALDILVLGAGESFRLETGGYETAIVPLSANVTIVCESHRYRLARKDVFAEKGSALCLPSGTEALVTATKPSELALCRAKSEVKGEVVFIPQSDAREKTVGRENWRRTVVDIVDERAGVQSIVLGETYNEPGCWSSFPPHKHDVTVPGVEAEMEEIYLFRTDPPEGFGTQSIYSDETESYTFTVRDFDAVTIPWGYHPVSAMPGYRLYYLWFLAGEGRTLMPNTEPKYRWLLEER